jgi:predicted hotdog family 3-hydroxylacyl-ACP dehydratase
VHALEYGAQAMAVHGGLLARAAGETVSSGYLAALRDARLFINRLDDLSGPLIVRATQLMAGQGNMIYQIHIEHAGQVVASARATVVTGGKSIA